MYDPISTRYTFPCPTHGEGRVRLHDFRELDRLGYAGFVGCEYNPRGKTTDGLGWFRPYAGARP